MTDNKRQLFRIGLNIGMIVMILFFTLSNTRTYVSLHPEKATGLYVHTILFNSIVLFAIVINNRYLIPQLLFHKKRILYFLSSAFLLIIATVMSSIYVRYLFGAYPGSELGNFTLFAIDLELRSDPFVEVYFITFVHTLLFLTGSAIAFIIRHLFIRNKDLQLTKEEQLKAELNTLKAQVNPHFLFNMMNSIYSLSLNRSDEAPATILKLSEILRYNLYETANNFVPLSKELHIIRTYLALERMRSEHPGSITFQNDIRSGGIMIAPMLILPIVENAFKHGIDSDISQGYVIMRAYENSEYFIFECSNSYKNKGQQSGNSGLGLKNLRRRLQLIYPGKHILEINKTATTFEVALQIKINNELYNS